MENYINFYPTPVSLLEKIPDEWFNWEYLVTVLEPSAGKGDIIDYINERSQKYFQKSSWHYGRELNIDCIEINGELRRTLEGKNYRVIGDDFLTYTGHKGYDLIIMNPPFCDGASHLLKALEIQKHGGAVICILNAETIKNPYTNERKTLVKKLEEYGADIQFMENEFVSAQRKTSVEIALIHVVIKKDIGESFILERMRKAHKEAETEIPEMTELADNDFIKAAVNQYQIEVKLGLEFIREYKALSPYILTTLDKNEYNRPIISLQICDKSNYNENDFVKAVRAKYWNALFQNEQFVGPMPENMRREYSSKVERLSEYEFSYFNIKEIQIQITNSLIKGIEKSIIALFDELSAEHSWYPECEKNIHYYNGWASNKAWYVNKKVIIPLHTYDNVFNRIRVASYDTLRKLSDMEKALNYLNGCPGANVWMPTFLLYRQEGKNVLQKYRSMV